MDDQSTTEVLPPVEPRKASEDTIIFTKDTPTCLNEKDAIERAIEGLGFAASNAKELNARQPNVGWNDVRESLLEMQKNVRKMATSKSPGKQEVSHVIDLMAKSMGG